MYGKYTGKMIILHTKEKVYKGKMVGCKYKNILIKVKDSEYVAIDKEKVEFIEVGYLKIRSSRR